ncbi:alpha/beta-hydrolase [Terfezia boudieri ATCC MYA-4762]|uniref:Alpha/beta-hydrolase n=1 Tax=Terfezia boudieri ATCC MYA-4762 TaxID=1051890 RepID=A0A3N4LW48_9PEZI|nr:alpha/beta-hydrolase [Terfezia boudieri ATCC MYA-4762]
MLLGKVTFIDIAVFLVFLSWHLLTDVGLYYATCEAINALPFLVTELPIQVLYERYLSSPEHRLAWTLKSSLFQDVVIHCVRYAFTNIDPKVGRVFLSKNVALPFLRFRMWRHAPQTAARVVWREVQGEGFKGVWIEFNETAEPDMVLYYMHGGGFVMGSPYFYLEFLIALNVHLRKAGFKNPAIFTLEYTLVPDAVYPAQLKEALAGYRHLLSVVQHSRICVAGDSAGGTLMLSLLLHMAAFEINESPLFATVFSPWTVLVSDKRNTVSDYLDSEQLNQYGRLYAGKTLVNDPIASPGCCQDLSLWRKAMPENGLLCIYGTEELLYNEIDVFLKMLENVGEVVRIEEPTVHVWPIAVMFLGTEAEERHRSVRRVAQTIYARMCP